MAPSAQITQGIRIDRPAHKFAAAHMTVFADGSKERLHGHNYQVAVEVEVMEGRPGQLVEFRVFKDQVIKLCEAWDEKVLLAEKCPQFQILRQDSDEFEFTLCGKRYLLPLEDVELLPLDNITTETLSRELGLRFLKLLEQTLTKHSAILRAFELRVDESSGQGAFYRWRK